MNQWRIKHWVNKTPRFACSQQNTTSFVGDFNMFLYVFMYQFAKSNTISNTHSNSWTIGPSRTLEKTFFRPLVPCGSRLSTRHRRASRSERGKRTTDAPCGEWTGPDVAAAKRTREQTEDHSRTVSGCMFL